MSSDGGSQVGYGGGRRHDGDVEAGAGSGGRGARTKAGNSHRSQAAGPAQDLQQRLYSRAGGEDGVVKTAGGQVRPQRRRVDVPGHGAVHHAVIGFAACGPQSAG